MTLPLFRSFYMGGFECATHRRRDRARVDVIDVTQHDRYARTDYLLLQEAGIFTVRDGLRWHLIETAPGQYRWESFLAQLEASVETGTQVIWDLCHWGLPDHIDVFSPAFPESFARFAAAAARFVQQHSHETPFFCLVNEISFWAWVGGDVEAFYPHATGRGPELKRQLVAATLAARLAVLDVEPRARFVQAEPIIHISARPDTPEAIEPAARHTAAQFEAWDWLRDGAPRTSDLEPGLPDIVGVNFYWDNQWIHNGEQTPPGHPLHRPLHSMLLATWERYRRPLLITETGAEAAAAVGWLGYVAAEVREAQRLGAEIAGICLYPVSDYPGWDDGRHCACGVITLGEDWTTRGLRPDLTAELRRQTALLAFSG